MCGIAGIFDYRGRAQIDRTLLRRSSDILGHRGPDGDGYHIEPGVGLGHRRLAIVDLATGDKELEKPNEYDLIPARWREQGDALANAARLIALSPRRRFPNTRRTFAPASMRRQLARDS